MVHCIIYGIADFLHFSVNFADAFVGKIAYHRIPSQCHYHPGRKEFDLPFEPFAARLDFVWERITVSRGPALYDIGDKDITSGEVNGPEKLFEKLTGGTDKWPSLLVLVPSRRFAYEQQVYAVRALTGDDSGPVFSQFAAFAALYLGIEVG
jgi:hypothetical protein